MAPLDPRKFFFEERDVPPGSGWSLAGLVETIRRGVLPADFLRFFDRDPERKAPGEPGAIVSPADGLLELRRTPGRVRFLIHIRMTDVHVQRVPLSGTVISVEHRGLGHRTLGDPDYWAGVHAATTIDSAVGPYTVRQLTTLVTRRLETYLVPGQAVKTGERLGRIRLGSSCDFELPDSVRVVAADGQRVTAGETVLARA